MTLHFWKAQHRGYSLKWKTEGRLQKYVQHSLTVYCSVYTSLQVFNLPGQRKAVRKLLNHLISTFIKKGIEWKTKCQCQVALYTYNGCTLKHLYYSGAAQYSSRYNNCTTLFKNSKKSSCVVPDQPHMQYSYNSHSRLGHSVRYKQQGNSGRRNIARGPYGDSQSSLKLSTPI